MTLIRSSLAWPTSRRGKNSHSSMVEVRRRIKAPRPPPEVVDSGFAVKISPRFPVSPTDLQSQQQPKFTDSLALFSGPLDMTFETRAILQVDSHWGMFSHSRRLFTVPYFSVGFSRLERFD